MYRPPEMLDLYLNYPINEALDIWVRIALFHSHIFINVNLLIFSFFKSDIWNLNMSCTFRFL